MDANITEEIATAPNPFRDCGTKAASSQKVTP